MPSIQQILQQSVSKLKSLYFDERQPMPAGLLEAMETDRRLGVRMLAARLRARSTANRIEGRRLRQLLKFETALWRQGFRAIAGVDEVGVGPMAGPLVAGAVVLPNDYKLRDLDDSKRLDEAMRENLATSIKEDAEAWSVGIVEVEEIDRLNVYQASLLAMQRALAGLSVSPDYVLVDARTIPGCQIPQKGIVHGDSLSASIAAASIIAKTTRDGMMVEIDREFPGYGFAAHKGYVTAGHSQALRRLGVSPVHRRSYKPVREVLGLEPVQGSLLDILDDR